MPNGFPGREQIDRFLVDEIDSVPQLEALLLIWRHRPRQWSSTEISRELYISPEVADSVLHHLEQHDLIHRTQENADCYYIYLPSEERSGLLQAIEDVHRRELVRISNLIHAKASRAVRDFASAFRFKKEEQR